MVLGVTAFVILILILGYRGDPTGTQITGEVVKEQKVSLADCQDQDMNSDGIVNAFDLARCAESKR